MALLFYLLMTYLIEAFVPSIVSEVCLTKCVNGRCRGEECLCHDGWTGESCELSRCDRRCDIHGVCHNGTCLCNIGWNGKHCSLGMEVTL